MEYTEAITIQKVSNGYVVSRTAGPAYSTEILAVFNAMNELNDWLVKNFMITEGGV
jgi:hypothetical protein